MIQIKNWNNKKKWNNFYIEYDDVVRMMYISLDRYAALMKITKLENEINKFMKAK